MHAGLSEGIVKQEEPSIFDYERALKEQVPKKVPTKQKLLRVSVLSILCCILWTSIAALVYRISHRIVAPKSQLRRNFCHPGFFVCVRCDTSCLTRVLVSCTSLYTHIIFIICT